MANRAILMLAAMAAAVVSVAGMALAKDFTGTDRSDFIKGTADADLIRALDGDDVVFSKDGKDDLRGNPGDDILGGQGGRDTYHGGSGQRPHLRHPAGDAGPPKGGYPGADVMHVQEGNDHLEGGRGNDTLYGGPNGTGSNAWSDREQLFGNRGDDEVYGEGGADYMEGQQGRDRTFGGKGGDTLDAADRETAGTPDTVDCGPGIDTAIAQPGSLPGGEALAWIAAWQLPIMNGLPVLYLLLFPTGRLPSRRWRPVAWLTVAFVVVGVVLAALSPGAYLGSLGPIRNPLGIEGLTGIYKAVFFTMAPLLIVAAVLSVFVRLRGSVGIERQQLKWFAYAVAAFAVGIILVSVIEAVDTPSWFERAGVAFFVLAGAAYPIAIGVAILRYRLYDIDRIINRTLVYGSLTGLLALVYLGSVVGLQATLRILSGQESTLAVVASTLVIAALFNPLRRQVQAFVDRRFYRRKYDAAKILEALNARLRDETDLDALSGDLVGVASRTVQPDHVSLWLRPHKHEARSGPLEQSGHAK